MHELMVVDDEQLVLNSLRRTVGRRPGISLEAFSEPEEALRCLQVKNFDLIISDYRMPAMTGVEFLAQARELQPRSVRLILSGYADKEALVDAINQARIFRFVSKPWGEEELNEALEAAFEERQRILSQSAMVNEYQRELGSR